MPLHEVEKALQLPLTHFDVPPHELPSLTAGCVQPPALAAHLSVVHALKSLQSFAPPPWQLPLAHWSPTVHGLLSLHPLLFGGN